MSANPIDDGGPAYPRDTKWSPDGSICQHGSAGQSYRADVAKLCLASLMSRRDMYECSVDDLVSTALIASDTLIARLSGGPR